MIKQLLKIMLLLALMLGAQGSPCGGWSSGWLGVAEAQAVTASLSGTVSYAGSKTGRVFISVQTSQGKFGTSIASPGSYTIRGVPAGNYTVYAFLDNMNIGAPVHSSPVGAITASAGSTTANITLNDAAPAAPVTPDSISVVPGPASVLFRCKNVVNADSYTIYWSNVSSVSKSAYIGSKTVPAGNDAPVLIDGLTDGSAYYFIAVATSEGLESATSTVFGPVTVGVTSGGNTVSGTINYTGPAITGPLYVLITESAKDGMSGLFYTKISNPSTSQNFSVSGIPNGTYYVYPVIDMNNNGLFGYGDVYEMEDAAVPIVSLTGSGASGVTHSLAGDINALAFIKSDHGKDAITKNEWISLNSYIVGKIKRPVSITMTASPAGSGVSVPVDYSIENGYINPWFNPSARPLAGDTYTYLVTYADNTTETLSPQVTAILDSFPTNPAINESPVTTVPTFTWGAPDAATNPPTSYTYDLDVNDNNQYWGYTLPSTQLSAQYQNGGGGQAFTLVTGTQYNWNISVQDQYSNRATLHNTFTPGLAATSYVVTFNSNGGSAVTSQTIAGNGTATAPATPVKAGYAFGGWYADSGLTSAFSFSTPITADITLYARWTINTFSVAFNSNGGSAITIQKVANNGTATEPAAPVKAGSSFAGWYADSGLSSAFNFTTPITANITLYAKWTANLQGTLKIPKTGQTTCYDTFGAIIPCAGTGQDGEKQAGAAQTDPQFTDNGNGTITDKIYGVTWQKDGMNAAIIPTGIVGVPTPRFTDNGNGTQTDNLTGLVWLKNVNCFGAQAWANALNAANNLKGDNSQCGLNDGSIAGDWRLPNINELISVVTNYAGVNPMAWFNNPELGFTGVQSNYYWSSSTFLAVADGTDVAWIVGMSDVYSFIGFKTDFNYVWPVRSGHGVLGSLALSKTGTGTGSVSSNLAGISCGTACSASFTKGQTVVLTATADNGSSFTSWTGCDSTNANQCTVSANGAISVTAAFTHNSAIVTFDSNGGSAVGNQSVAYKGTATAPAVPTKTGYTFAGWYSDSGLTSAFIFTTPITADTTLYGKWRATIYHVSFNSNGGSAVGNQSVTYNTTATAPAAPVKAGFAFVGWYGDSGLISLFSFTTPITASTTLYAKWTANSYAVSFDSADGSAVTSQSVIYNTAAIAPVAPTKLGYSFAGWYSDATLTTAFAFATLITTDTTLYAKWTINRYNVTFNSNGGSAVASQSVIYNTAVTEPATPTKSGYTFAGWYSDAALTTAFTFATLITTDTTLYAKWTINSYTVSFTSNGGSTVTSQSVIYNTAATAPAMPTKPGYTFAGWYSDAALTAVFVFTTPIIADTTLYAKWTINGYSVTFNSNGGSAVTSQNIAYNGTATAPVAPTKTGYTFGGWYADSGLTSAFSFTTPITADTTLYAKWTANTYSITFASNGNGTLTGAASQTITHGGSATAVSAIPATGYRFVNWTGTGGFVSSTANPLTVTNVTAAQTVTANFEVIAPVITLPSGDINGDGKIDLTDAFKMLEIAVGRVSASAADLAKADIAPLVNGKPAPDGVIGIGDVVVALRRIVDSVSW